MITLTRKTPDPTSCSQDEDDARGLAEPKLMDTISGMNVQPGTAELQWNAKLYEQKHSFVWQYGTEVLKILAPQPGELILDLGCGTAQLTAQIAAAGARVIGLDNSPAMIEQARINYPELRFEIADAQDFRFAEPFDAVFSNAVLHWVSAADRVARSLFLALKPGGRFVAEFGGRGCVREIRAAGRAALSAIGLSPEDEMNSWYFPSIAEYSSVLESQGLSVTSAWLFDRPTKLEDGEPGLRQWIRMFCNNFLNRIPQNRQDEFLAKWEDSLRPKLFRDGSWFVDYKRIRLVAVKETA